MTPEFLSFAAIVAVIWFVVHTRRRQSARLRGGLSPEPGGDPRARLYELASELGGYFGQTAHPSDLLGHAPFLDGVAHVTDHFQTRELLDFYRGDNAIIACLALESIVRGEGEPEPALVTALIDDVNSVAYWSRYFVLRILTERVPASRPVAADILAVVDASWNDRIPIQFLRDFIIRRHEQGETIALGEKIEPLPEGHLEFVKEVLRPLPDAVQTALKTEIETWVSSRVDVEFLSSVGTVVRTPGAEDGDPVIRHAPLVETVERITALLGGGRSVALVGEPGVGKSSTLRALADSLVGEGWVIFGAGYSQLLAGQAFIGELEGRLEKLVRSLRGRKKLVWFVPEFHQLQWAGRHRHSPVSVLDQVLPYIETGQILVVGELSSAAYEKLIQANPRCLHALEVCRLEPLNDAETLDIAAAWSMAAAPDAVHELIAPDVLREAWHLARQYRGDQAAPGNLLHLLNHTRKSITTDDGQTRAITLDDLLSGLSSLTGLPASILDDRQQLNLSGLRALFEARVMGQPEAVNTLVERVAMIKAGVTDPTRPLGVFLFAGPTGTGKTEIAKTLADYLFGSSERMIRIDMSELQTPEALTRLTGSDETSEKGSLTDKIRKQPFSVVLLDEFEKAHSTVWDLFLQVFDDGRLTDALGNTADFRQAIIIMTSNLGGFVPGGMGLGFLSEKNEFSTESVHRTVAKVFRPEFLNRIDRTVVFRPLSRETIRTILHKELGEVMERRGLRNRTWAVEWEEDAIEFLLTRGFTRDLGARPLKRAIERYFLSPLALTIVEHRFPEGDQFLFVRTEGDHLHVEFVDPDAEPKTAADELSGSGPPDGLSLPAIAYHARGVADEISFLEQCYKELKEQVEGETWQSDKKTALEMTSGREFWNSEERFAILGEIELIDRIENALQTPGSLLGRLAKTAHGNQRYATDLVGRLAHQLYLLDQACASKRDRLPQDAFLTVDTGGRVTADPTRRDAFADRLVAMYKEWGKKRRMRVEVLEERGTPGTRSDLTVGFSGFGAYRILARESGLHVFEYPDEGTGGSQKVQTRVRVVAQPETPPRNREDALKQARLELEGGEPATPQVVRRYREEPSPLVRDAVRGWKTGRADRVFAGDFDLVD